MLGVYMSLKEIIRCKDCANRMYDLGVGFTAEVNIICVDNGRQVDEDDGCTFGIVGEHCGYASRDYDVSLNGHEAVNGRWLQC